MAIALQKLSLKLTLICFCVQVVFTQRLPPNNCNSIFHYERQGDHWIGHVISTQHGLKSVDWTLRFVSHGVGEPGTISGLSGYPDEAAALQRLLNGGQAECFVRFDGYRDELPKIVHVELNGQVLCTASEYEAPSTTITRKLYLSISTSTTYNVVGSFPNFDKPSAPSTYMSRPPLLFFNQPATTTARPVTTTMRPLLFINQKVTSTAKLSSPTASPLPSFASGEKTWNKNPFLPQLTSRKPDVAVNTRQDPPLDECGVEGFGGLQYGGETVPRGRFPWLAALYHDSNSDPNKIELNYKCVTTLISKRTVITAAHCIYGSVPAELRVYVGRHDVTLHPEKDAVLMFVETVHTHPDFVGNLVPDSDLGLLVLTEPVQYSLYVRPICLWSSTTSLGIDDGEQAAVAGWGIDSKFKPTRFPMTVNVKPVSREECLREMVTAKDFLTPRTLCAGNSEGHGPCLGDSGGGLMVLRNNRWLVRGIVSLAQRAGNGCDLSRFVIYCDVARHLSWIERNNVR